MKNESEQRCTFPIIDICVRLCTHEFPYSHACNHCVLLLYFSVDLSTELSNLKIGDKILEINGTPVKNKRDVRVLFINLK